jgi:hypothetical protein
MSKARLEESRPCRLTYPADGAVLEFGRSKYRAKAWEYAARAQVISDPQQRADLLRFAGMWLSLTESTDDELRGAYEVPPEGRLAGSQP